MRARILIAPSLLATLTFVACKTDAPTSTHSATQSSASPALAPFAASRAGTSSVVLPPVGGFTSTQVARGSFVDLINLQLRVKAGRETEVANVSNMGDMVSSHITLLPNFSLPWHSHPGPAFVTVNAGSLTVLDGKSCTTQTYTQGMSFADVGQGHVHIAYNTGAVTTDLSVTYVGVPAGASPLIPTTNPGC